MTAAITYLSVCSGLGGAALALDQHGFREVACAEIEPFCAALLDYRYAAARVMCQIAHLGGVSV